MEYKCLKNQVFKNKEYIILPIRYEDRLDILKWRNEQIYHLRQPKPLTIEDQDNYFKNVVSKLFEQEKPNQILFSFLKNDELVAYGGLVHINWIDKHAEISFLMNTELEKDFFTEFWANYLKLIEVVAFNELNFHKIFTFAFDLRPHLYPVVESCGFKLDGVLKEHYYFDNKFIDAVIHSKFNRKVNLRKATVNDVEITYNWVNCPEIRRFSFNKNFVHFEEHKSWFLNKINSPLTYYYIVEYNNDSIGSVRVDFEGKTAKISYLIDKKYHGKGLGSLTLLKLEDELQKIKEIEFLTGDVLKENVSSIKIFNKLNYNRLEDSDLYYKFNKKIN